jgi:putative DNA primase/helicase
MYNAGLAKKRLKTLGYQAKCFVLAIDKLYDDTFEDGLNKIPYLFPTDDGQVVDLRTGKPEPRLQKHMFSFACPVHLDNDEERLAKVDDYYTSLFLDDEEMKTYFTRVLGYCLSGEIDDRGFYIWFGIGRNGKSKLLDIMKTILTKNWCAPLSRAAVILSRGADRHAGRATTEINKLERLRFAYFNESERDDELNSANLKNVTGGDEVSNRKQYGEEGAFKSQAKIFLSTNYRAKWDFESEAMMDRARQIPAEVRFVPSDQKELRHDERRGDMQLMNDLLDKYLSANFTYLVKRCVEFYGFQANNMMIPVPKKCTDSVKNLVKEHDTVQIFIDECVVEDGETKVPAGLMYDEYKKFTRNNEKRPVRVSDFKAQMEKKGMVHTRSGSSYWVGYHLECMEI